MNSEDKVESTADHCVYCFDVIIDMLSKKNSKASFLPFPTSIPKILAPLFVTWHKDGELRGCIGTFSKEPIEDNLPKYAAISAFKDSRFDPISMDEVPRLTCSVSLLTNFEKVKDPFDWEVGKHGITIEVNEGYTNYRGTFLPEVAKEQGWSKEETLKYLLRKAGCGKSLESVINKIQLERYQSSKFHLSYSDYLKLKNSS